MNKVTVMLNEVTVMLNEVTVMLNEVKHLYHKDPSLTLRMTRKKPQDEQSNCHAERSEASLQ